ncbi:hypothetical protein GGX14DRAFT_644577 [Mycena pura]|uniref:Anti-proliferative protein domain-containing protein n=1 Tax=Mycena pura TaxID=153505 RepID=A0AAD6Y7D3_9AGAR|nr:hypothetical protein GGX14DRAFT_644577 [Mycena pura]
MSSAIPHVTVFLTRPLLARFPPAAVTAAQVILNAALAAHPSAVFTLTAAGTPPAALHAASLGAGIPWAQWFAALAGADADAAQVLLVFGPGFVKARVGDAPVADVWSEDAQGSVVRISQVGRVPQAAALVGQPTGGRLRATLLSARARSMRHTQSQGQDQAATIRLPSLLAAASALEPTPASDDSASDSDSYCSDSDDSDAASATSSSSTACSLTSVSESADSPTKILPRALPPTTTTVTKYTPPRRRPLPVVPAPPSASALSWRRAPARAASCAKKDTTAYLYQGGVTRVMTGGVMLGPRPGPGRHPVPAAAPALRACAPSASA